MTDRDLQNNLTVPSELERAEFLRGRSVGQLASFLGVAQPNLEEPGAVERELVEGLLGINERFIRTADEHPHPHRSSIELGMNQASQLIGRFATPSRPVITALSATGLRDDLIDDISMQSLASLNELSPDVGRIVTYLKSHSPQPGYVREAVEQLVEVDRTLALYRALQVALDPKEDPDAAIAVRSFLEDTAAELVRDLPAADARFGDRDQLLGELRRLSVAVPDADTQDLLSMSKVLRMAEEMPELRGAWTWFQTNQAELGIGIIAASAFEGSQRSVGAKALLGGIDGGLAALFEKAS